MSENSCVGFEKSLEINMSFKEIKLKCHLIVTAPFKVTKVFYNYCTTQFFIWKESFNITKKGIIAQELYKISYYQQYSARYNLSYEKDNPNKIYYEIILGFYTGFIKDIEQKT